MSSPLFREEVVAARQVQWLGAIRLARRPSFLAAAAIAAGLALGLVLFGVWGEVTRKARLPGILVSVEGIFDLTSSQAGQVTDLKVKEGDQVHRGDLLAVVSTDRNTTEGTLAQLVSRTLEDRRNSLEAERRVIEHQVREQQQSLNLRLRNLESEQTQAHADLKIVHQRIGFAAKTVERFQQLAKDGFVSPVQVQQKQEELLDLEAREGSFRRSLTAVTRDTLILKAEQSAASTTLNSQLARVDGNLATLAQEVAENKARGQIAILAPRDAIVSALSARIGQIVVPGKLLMTLIPRDKERSGVLQAQLYSPSRAAGFLQTGQQVWLRVAAYPYQKFGMTEGYVTAVSRTPIQIQELPASQGQALADAAHTNEPLYRIDVKISQQAIKAYGQIQTFKPGMAIQADVVQDRRTVWEWLLDPILAGSASLRTAVDRSSSSRSF